MAALSVSAATTDPLAEFLKWVGSHSASTSEEVRSKADTLRDAQGRLPDEVLRISYPEFYELQLQIDAARGRLFGRTIHVAESTLDSAVVWPQPLNFRGLYNVKLVFPFGYTVASRFTAELATTPVVDGTGSIDTRIEGLKISIGSGTTSPGCGILFARTSYETNANGNRLVDCDVRGAFGDHSAYGGACYAFIGAEVTSLVGLNGRFSGIAGSPFYTSGYNVHRFSSPYGVIAGGSDPGGSGSQSNAFGNLHNCRFALDNLPLGANPSARCVLDIGTRTCSLSMTGQNYLTAKTAGSCLAAIKLGNEEDKHYDYGGVWGIDLANIHDEAYAAEYFIFAHGHTDRVALHNTAVRSRVVVDGPGRFEQSGIRMDNVTHSPHPDYWG